MASDGSRSDLPLRLVLTLAIVGLTVALLYVTVVPAQKAAEAEALSAKARERMGDVRSALTAYYDQNERSYPATLDSLALFARADSLLQARVANEEERLAAFDVDSMFISPRSGQRFEYAVSRDTSNQVTYWLGDPGMPSDSIGARGPDGVRFRNAGSWE